MAPWIQSNLFENHIQHQIYPCRIHVNQKNKSCIIFLKQLKLGAGELQAKTLTANHDSRIDGGAGSITITNGALNNADIDVAVGELDFSGTLTGESSVDYGIGETRITLAGSEKGSTVLPPFCSVSYTHLRAHET